MGDIASLVPVRASFPALSTDDWADMFSFGNLPFRLQTTMSQDREEIGTDFAGLALGAFRANATVFAVEMKRLQLFSQVVFKFRAEQDGRLFGNRDLAILEHPEIGETTQDLLLRALLYADYGGDAIIVRRPNRLKVLRPDWTVLILGSPDRAVDPQDVDIELIGVGYREGGLYSERPMQTFGRSEFAHYVPVRDPLARYRGIPWVVPALRTIMGDTAATTHKLKFYEHSATPNLVVTLDPSTPLEKAREWIELFEQEHKGAMNAYRTAFLGGGASAQSFGKDFQQMDFKVVQGAGQTLIAAAGGIHPTVAGLSEGLQGSSLNAGNFKEAAQLVGDTFLRPEWAKLAGSLEVIVPPPAGSRLWYDESRVSFLKEDVKDAATVLNLQAAAIRTLWDGGGEPDSVVNGVTTGDLSRIRQKYITVQVQPSAAAEESDPVRQPAALSSGAVPMLAAGSYEIRCTGTRSDGTPCGQLIVKADHPGPLGIEGKCLRCGALVAA